MTDQPALKAGDTVVIFTSRYGEMRAEAPTAITRETKTQLLVGLRRFRKRDLREVGDFGAWTPTPELKRPDDPMAIRAVEESEARNRLNRTRSAVSGWASNVGDRDALDAAISALIAYRDHQIRDTR